MTPDFCEAHLERTGEKLPAYKMGLCEACYRGEPIDWKKELLGGHEYSERGMKDYLARTGQSA